MDILRQACLSFCWQPWGLSACSSIGFPDTGSGKEQQEDQGADAVIGSGRQTLKIVSGSENQELEPILEEFSEKSGIRIEMTYQGSLDIMRTLGQETIEYDAVWPGPAACGSTWGDTEHRIKHAESISITPVVFGIRQSLAEELGFVGREVSCPGIFWTPSPTESLDSA